MPTLSPAIDLYVLGERNTPDSWFISTWNAGQTNTMSWSEDNVRVANDGAIELLIDRAPAGASRPWEGGEIQSNEVATTGTWSWTAKAPEMAPGAVFGMFTYKNDWKNQPWVEFDFEFVGGDTTKVQLNVHMEDAQGRHIVPIPSSAKRAIVDLGFDASKGYHTYEVSVTHKDATFYIDGKEVGHFSGADMPGGVWQIGPMKSYVDLWTVASGQEAWAGKWTDPGRTLVASVSGVDIRAGEYGSAITPEVVEQPGQEGPVVGLPTDPQDGPDGPTPITGTDGDDVRAGTGGADTILGLDGNDALDGLDGNDVLYGGAGHDTLTGGPGADALYGGTGNDVYWVDNAADKVVEQAGEGYDLVNASVSWTLPAHVEALALRTAANSTGTGNGLDNFLKGNSGHNVLSGLGGNDLLEGHGGNDTLVGGVGNDTLVGGAGKDTFRFASGDGHDIVRDFEARLGEVLDIRGHEGVQELREEAGGTRVVLSSTDSIFLTGVQKGDLSVGNFLFNGQAPKALEAPVPAPVPAPEPSPSVPDTAEGATGANLLVNGSFEATKVASNTAADFGKVSGWTAIDGGRIEIWNALKGVKASDGQNFLELDYRGARDGFYQDVQTQQGQSYTLTFDLRARPGYAASTQQVEVVWNGKVVATATPKSGWDTFAVEVVGTSGADRLTIREVASQGGDGYGAMLDNFALVHTDAATLPADPVVKALMGTAGADRLVGTFSADTLYGLDGNDTLDGRGGADVMYGGRGNDVYWIDDAADKVVEQAGEGYDLANASVSWTLPDHVEALALRTSAHINGTGNGLGNFITGNSGRNTLWGMDGNDVLEGRGGNDVLYGGAGRDTLKGGLGADVLYGGRGEADVFVWQSASESRPGTGHDVVMDFESGLDRLDFSAIDARPAHAGNDAFAWSQSGPAAHALWSDRQGADLLVRGDTTGDGVADIEVVLHNTSALLVEDLVL